MTATEALAKALETNWWGLNGHIGQEAADKLRTALHSEGYTIVQEAELERLLAAEPGALRAALERTADLPEDAPPPGMKADWYAAGWGDRGDALCAALSATQDGTPGLDEERLARILHEVLPEDAAEHAPHGDRYCDYIADCIVDRYDDPDWPTPRLSTSEPRREDEG